MNWKMTKKEQTVRTAIKQNSSPDCNSPYYAIRGVLEKETNATSNSNIWSLRTTLDKDLKKISEEFIFKACWNKIFFLIAVILSTSTVLCLSYFLFVFILKLVSFYNRVDSYSTIIFLILLLQPVDHQIITITPWLPPLKIFRNRLYDLTSRFGLFLMEYQPSREI